MKDVELYGIVLCGGKSSRMGTDKSLLNYHGIGQRYYLCELLNQFCARTFISCNANTPAPDGAAYNFIHDHPLYSGNGPISGLVSAFSRFPTKNMLLIGCDYPFLEADHISYFLSQIPADAIAAAFYNHHENYYEPVLAWYSVTAGVMVRKYLNEGHTSLQQFLVKINAYKVQASDTDMIRSVDTYDEYLSAIERLANKNKIFNA